MKESTRQLQVLGVSFRSAPLVVRETLGFDPQQKVALLRELSSAAPDVEAAVLSTCNRTEFYLVADSVEDGTTVLFRILRRLRPQAAIHEPDCQRYEYAGDRAVRHVFRVACGLESAVLGDVQILSQMKDCRQLAVRAATLGKHLGQVFDDALEAGKRARLETNISNGNASIGSAVAGILSRHFRDF